MSKGEEMKYCSKCGKELHDEAIVCPHCGCGAENVNKKESKALGILSIIFGALGGWLGLILGIIGLCVCKEQSNKRNCIIGMCLFGAWILIYIFFYEALLTAFMSMMGGMM